MSKRTPLILVLVLVLTTLSFPAALAADHEETVRLVVPASHAPQALTAENPEAHWVTVEVPVVGGMESTLERARDRFGPDISVERFYELAVNPNDDDLYDEQWHLENDGIDADIDAERAWGVADGSGVVVAVIDSGIEESHPDLTGQIITGIDYVDGGDPGPGDKDDDAHGTNIAGLIAAADNDIGVVGVAPGARVLNMRACTDGLCSNLDLVNAIEDSADAGADIINLSLGSYGLEEVGDPALEAAIEYARDRNVLVVAAGGNDDVNLDHLETDEGESIIIIPAGLPLGNILAVGASDHLDRRAEFSNYGSVLDLFAPGTEMATTGLGQTGYERVPGGTSFSAPVVAGVAALLLSHDPGIGYQELIARVVAFTDKPDSLNAPPEVRVNAGKALTNRFIDTSDSVFHDTIKWLAEQNITEGCNPPRNHEYCPGDNVTRGQMAVFFARTFGLPATSTDYFDDDDGQFYENSANRMAEAGITVGCDSRQYCGERDISRGEMAAMLSRVLSLPSSSTDHFGDDDGSTFESAINRIADANITQGCNPPDNDRYCPEDDVNRGQMAAFLQRSASLAD